MGQDELPGQRSAHLVEKLRPEDGQPGRLAPGEHVHTEAHMVRMPSEAEQTDALRRAGRARAHFAQGSPFALTELDPADFSDGDEEGKEQQEQEDEEQEKTEVQEGEEEARPKEFGAAFVAANAAVGTLTRERPRTVEALMGSNKRNRIMTAARRKNRQRGGGGRGRGRGGSSNNGFGSNGDVEFHGPRPGGGGGGMRALTLLDERLQPRRRPATSVAGRRLRASLRTEQRRQQQQDVGSDVGRRVGRLNEPSALSVASARENDTRNAVLREEAREAMAEVKRRQRSRAAEQRKRKQEQKQSAQQRAAARRREREQLERERRGGVEELLPRKPLRPVTPATEVTVSTAATAADACAGDEARLVGDGADIGEEGVAQGEGKEVGEESEAAAVAAAAAEGEGGAGAPVNGGMGSAVVVAPWQKEPEGKFVPLPADGSNAEQAAATAVSVGGGGRWVRCEGGFDGAAAWEWAE